MIIRYSTTKKERFFRLKHKDLLTYKYLVDIVDHIEKKTGYFVVSIINLDKLLDKYKNIQ